MRQFIYNDYKYHVITECDCNGLDEKPEVKTMKQAKEASLWYLNNGYNKVFILTEERIVKVFDRNCRSGRNPEVCEVGLFSFAKPKEKVKQLDLFAV